MHEHGARLYMLLVHRRCESEGSLLNTLHQLPMPMTDLTPRVYWNFIRHLLVRFSEKLNPAMAHRNLHGRRGRDSE
jgi:hypothetical protein